MAIDMYCYVLLVSNMAAMETMAIMHMVNFVNKSQKSKAKGQYLSQVDKIFGVYL